MRIVLDCRSVFDGMGGIGRATASLARELPRALTKGQELALIFGARRPKEPLAQNVQEVTADAAMIDPEFEQIRLPALLEELRADVYHNPCFATPLAPGAAKTIATVHDVVFKRRPDLVEPKLRTYLDRWTQTSCEYADAVLTVSDYSRREIQKLYGRDASVIPNAVGEEFFRIERKPIDGPPFVLYVGSIEPKKNVEELILGFDALFAKKRDLEHHLVLAGSVSYMPAVPERAKSRVHFLGHVPEEHLRRLYGAASAFAYLSEYEGFGLPPLEAMAAGVPTVVADRTSLPEVTDGAAELVDPQKPTDVARGLGAALEGRDQLRIERGRKAAARFEWQKSARMLAEVYEAVTQPSLKVLVGGPK
ncbi:MAG TPA: glycosyltransferase family 1 protein [Planctomycetota bacterium]|nr:glycosyltransferase family 1 protein [Planctomycetota bacterium]